MKIDEYEVGSQISSSVDDVFYIFKTCISRVLSTSDSSSICTLLGSIGRILESEFIAVFQKRLTNAFSASASSVSSDAKDANNTKVAAMVLLNNIDTGCEYLQKLVKEVDADVTKLFGGVLDAQDLEGMRVCLGTIMDYGNSFKKILMVSEQSFS
jgi:hypothetical protein